MVETPRLQNAAQKPKIKNKGFTVAQYAGSVAAVPLSVAGSGAVLLMRKTSEISSEQSTQLSQAVTKALNNTGLYEKGVRVLKAEEVPLRMPKNYEDIRALLENLRLGENDKDILEILKKESKSNKILKKLFKNQTNIDSAIDSVAMKMALQYKAGLNACFLPETNKIITPDNHLQTSVFHEMGHALNANSGIILKALQKMRPVSIIAPSVILLISLLNKRKTTDEQSKNDSKIQKGADFIKRNAGKLTALSFLPMLAEEGIASIRGQGIAKKLVEEGSLSKEIFKKIKLTNLGGFSSYALSAAAATLAAVVAVKVKDKIQANYEKKQLEKAEKQN